MIKRVSYNICNFLYKRMFINKELLDVYVYGFELIISSLSGILFILIIGLLLNNFTEGMIFLVCIASVRFFTGGYHAKSYMACNLMLISLFLICIWINKIIQINLQMCTVLFFLNELFVYTYIPIENKNKPLTTDEMKKNKRLSLVIIMLYYTIAITLIALKKSVGNFILIVLLFLFITSAVELLKKETYR